MGHNRLIVTLLLVLSAPLDAFEVVLALQRVILIGEDAIAADTYVSGNRPRGMLAMEIAEDMTVARMRFDAHLDGEQLVFEDAIAVGYAQTGGRYELYSLIAADRFDITFLRRELDGFSPDPATIFLVPLLDGRIALLDYRFSQ